MEWYHIVMVVMFTIHVATNVTLNNRQVVNNMPSHEGRVFIAILKVFIISMLLYFGGFWN